ncbi:MAG: pyridoxal-phosphate dependent enzyme [Chloroflexi bacterium]|nr:pyridoxal-phosphate dependent enzyme [Chloroflexota bacterium]MCY3696102.1 pyridoxal-phosphate dependent enzyme [Chloroflexota bacterium]
MSGNATGPTLDEVRLAREIIGRTLSLPTPLVHSPALSDRWDADVSLKLECVTPTSAFKVRGGVYLASQLAEDERQRGLVTSSTGNHAQSIAFGAASIGVEATIFMPANANPDKVAATRRLGGNVELVGERFDDARRLAEEFAAERGARYVEPIEPRLIAGVGTAALEVLEDQQPDTDLVLLPLGGGSGSCGWVTVRDGLRHHAEIWAAQSAQSPAAHDAWRSGRLEDRPNRSLAEGVATGSPFALALDLLRGRLNEFILVDDAQIVNAICLLWDLQHVMAEPAGAVGVAAAEQERERLAGKRVVIVISGANATRSQLLEWLRD